MEGIKEFNMSPLNNFNDNKNVYDFHKISSPIKESNIMLLFSEDEDPLIPIFSKANSNISAFSKVNFENSKSNINNKNSFIRNRIQTNISNEKTSASHSTHSLNSSPLAISKV